MKSRIFILMVLLLIASLTSNGDPIAKQTSFVSGAPVGDLLPEWTECEIEPLAENSAMHHLVLAQPGASVVRFKFVLDSLPSKLYLRLDERTNTIDRDHDVSVEEIVVNGERIKNGKFYYDIFLTDATPIAQKCHVGTNTVEIRLMEGSNVSVWIRQIAIEEIGSFTGMQVASMAPLTSVSKLFILVILTAGVVLLTVVIDTVLWKGLVRNPISSGRMTLLTIGLLVITFTLCLYGASGVSLLSAFGAAMVCILIAWAWQRNH